MMKIIKPFFTISLLLLLCACGSRKDVVYFQDASANNNAKTIASYSPEIKPDDMLTIIVSSLDEDLAKPFNLPAVSFVQSSGRISPSTQQSYLVDGNGNIEFPVLGTIKLAGLNRSQATELIKKMLKEYFTQPPIVNLRIVNFKVTVLGEVRRPGVYTIQNDRLTILEALGLAGDLNLQANRQNALVVREIGGKKTYHRINLTSETIFNSPVYYMSQNDVIYIEPNNSRIKSSAVGPNTNATLSVIGTLATVAALIVSITR